MRVARKGCESFERWLASPAATSSLWLANASSTLLFVLAGLGTDGNDAATYIGLAAGHRRQVFSRLEPATLVFLYGWLIHAGVAVQSRYLAPVRPALIILTAAAASAWLSRPRPESADRPRTGRAEPSRPREDPS